MNWVLQTVLENGEWITSVYHNYNSDNITLEHAREYASWDWRCYRILYEDGTIEQGE